MSKSANGFHETGEVQDHPAPKPEEIRLQLAHILASRSFHGSKRCQQFLEYVCEKYLSGQGGALKERTIAIEVFGRQPHSDLGEDTIVRVGAREVRKRLAQYYVTPEGAASELRIELPLGSYAPEFRYVAAPQAEEPPEGASVVEVQPPHRWTRRLLLAGLLAAAALVITVTVVSFVGVSPEEKLFRRFWAPILKSEEPLLVAVAHPLVYRPSGRAIKLSEASLPAQEIPSQRPIQAPPKQLDVSDFVPVFNQYVGFGDLVAASKVSSMLSREGKGVRLRMASGIEFADLRQAPVLLIGALTNRWTMQLQQAWRFRFIWTPGTRTVIADSKEPNSLWSIPQRDDGSAPDDYIMISRITNSITGGTLLAGAGLKQFGTEAAGSLLVEPEQLANILRKLPQGWESKNLQLVLHAKVINNTAAQPELVAWHVW